MADMTLIYTLVGLGVVQAVLTLLAVFYAYRVTRAIGLFWAWGFIVAAFAIDAFRNITSVIAIFFLPLDQISAILATLSSSSIWFPQLESLATAGLLVLGMRGLVGIFMKPKVAEPTPVRAPSISRQFERRGNGDK